MYGAHKKDSTPHSSLYLLIKIASLANYWSRTCIVQCAVPRAYIVNIDREIMHVCVFCT